MDSRRIFINQQQNQKPNKMKRLYLILLISLFANNTKAGDSTKTLALGEFLQVVKKYHPLSQQASLTVDKANANLTNARGGFNPLLSSAVNEKTFDAVNYYKSSNVQINIPTWYGIELQTGIEYLEGSRTDPQQTAGRTGFVGVSVPLLKNLLIDKRRATLQQAKIMVGASAYEKQKMLNDLLMEATDTYWQWVQCHLVYKNYANIIELNNKRVNMVTKAYQLGDRPAIDTIEAITQLQQFEWQQNEALLRLQNATVMLSTFLWKENNQPYELPAGIVPDIKIASLFNAVIFPDIETAIADAKRNHPDLITYSYKLSSLQIEKKLKSQELLPSFNLKYNQLGKGYNIASIAAKTNFDNNYRFGLSLSMPLLFSQGRGELKMAKIKLTETKLQQQQKEIEITGKIKSYYNELVNYKTQVTLLQKNYDSYLRLQQAEETRFLNGEGSLFLVNSRENKTQEAFLKLTETLIKYNKTSYALTWASGELWKL